MKKINYKSYRYNIFVFIIVLLYGVAYAFAGFKGTPYSSVKDLIFLVFQWGAVCVAVWGLLTVISLNKWIFAITFPLLSIVCSAFAYFSFTINVNVTPMLISLIVSNLGDYQTCSSVVDVNLILVSLFTLLLSIGAVVYRWKKIVVHDVVINLFLGIICIMLTNVWVKRIKNPVAERLPFSIFYSIDRYLEERIIIAEDRKTFTVSPKTDVDSLTVVMVLGESLRANHMQLNGYKRETMPLLSKEKNIVSYPNIYTEPVYTNVSVPHIMTRADSANMERAYQEESFVSIFKQAGYHSVWLANQESTESYVYFMNECDSLIFVNSGKSLYIIDKWLDSDIYPHYKNILREDYKKQLIVVHTIGSHWYYTTHFSVEDAKFQPNIKSKIVTSNTKEEMINSYDNTIVETDKVLHKFIDMLKDRNAILFFLSDHGESLGENGVFLHATDVPELHYPGCFVWYSDKYAANYPQKVEALKKNKDNYYRTDFLFHSILDGASIETIYCDKDLSIFQDHK